MKNKKKVRTCGNCAFICKEARTKYIQLVTIVLD